MWRFILKSINVFYDNIGDMFESFLQELGLSEKEAKVYLALLQFDRSTINELAKKTGVNRTTVYPVLETLEKKGLVSEVNEEKKTYYHAEAPERLETYVERQRVLLDEQAGRLKDMIPQIKSIQREVGERPVVKFFEGREGAISAYHEFYDNLEKNNKEGYFIYNRNLVDDLYTTNEKDLFLQIRKKKLVYPNTVYTKVGEDIEFKTDGKRVRLDDKTYPILADITVIDDKILISTLKGKTTSILIKSADIAVTLASLVKYINDNKKGS